MARWHGLAWVLLGACDGPKGDPDVEPVDTDVPAPCPDGRALVLAVTGAVGASEDAVAGVMDSSSWRLGEATPLTTTSGREGGTFTLCLTTDPTSTLLYDMAFFAAWIDGDDDGRLDAATEPLCDRTEAGTLLDELYFEGGAWRAGLAGTPGAPLSPGAALDGDHCSL
ncbi:MAG: hypothetical protein Q8P41_10930 [Pseudomonadota bacterium]|nr:hypothetical protein [Pseudomonadota bacterium]